MEKRGLLVIIGVSFLLLSVTAVDVSAEGLLSDVFNKIREWFDSSPFGGIFSQPVKRVEEIDMTFYPESFEKELQSPVNITSVSTNVYNFRGTIGISGRQVSLRESGTALAVECESESFDITGLEIPKLELENMRLMMISGNWNETTENGTVELTDFLGKAFVRNGSIELVGKVSKIIKG